MQTRTCLIAIVALTAVASAQTTVLPNGFTATEGNTSSAYPFGRGASACRVQYIYDSANMIAAGMNAPLFINTIDWRANGAAATLGGTHAGAGVTLKIGNCAFDHLAVSNTFDNNFAAGAVTNVLNPVSVATGAGTTPNNYTTSLTVPGGYFFDPNAGVDLVIEVSFPAGTWTGMPSNTTASVMDLHSAVGVGGSRLFATTNTAATATPQLNLAAIIRLGWTAAPGAATNQSYGAGCGGRFASFYEYTIPSTAFDLSNTAMTMTKVGTAPNESYLVGPGTTSYVPPSGTAVNLLLTDDSAATITPTGAFPYPGGSAASLTVCSNGFVSTGANGVSYQPSPAAFLAWATAAWAVWRDFIPNSAGADNVWWEEVGGVVYITWLNVLGYNGQVAGVTPSTFQFQFVLATGTVHIVFQSMDTVSLSTWAGGDGYLVGYSPGGPSIDPGNRDLSATLPATFVTTPADQAPLGLTASARPVINTSVVYTVTNVDPAALLTAHILSIGGVDPGLDLTPFGAPGCRQYIDLGIASTILVFGPSYQNSFSVPNDPSFAGLPLDNQAASLVPGLNALGASTSSAICSTIGTL